jgi:hypothetical protein
MTSEQLIEEGRRLMRPSVVLRPRGPGPVAAVYYERDEDDIESTGYRRWLSVDSRQIPGLPPALSGYLTILTDEEKCTGGRVELTESWPNRKGVALFAQAVDVLPPIDAVFARGSQAVEAWITAFGWGRTDRYNDNFKGRDIVAEYERVWTREYPLYLESDVYAVLGGWHFPGADDDWHELIDQHLMVLTLRDAEPRVEAWHAQSGDFRVIQRST